MLADTVLKNVVLKKVYLARDRCGTKNESVRIREGGSDSDGGGFCVIHSQEHWQSLVSGAAVSIVGINAIRKAVRMPFRVIPAPPGGSEQIA